jgi:crotonobetainyl-CoA:carnitine CoA-transferase CaiB-like acyl-CoA transferase
VRARPDLREVLEPLFRTRTTAEWIEVLDDADILCGPMLSYAELVAEEHVVKSGSLATVHHPATGEVRSPVFPGRFSDTPGDVTGPPPPLPGEHSETILSECGFVDDEIEQLLRDRVVSGSVVSGVEQE